MNSSPKSRLFLPPDGFFVFLRTALQNNFSFFFLNSYFIRIFAPQKKCCIINNVL